MRWLRTHMPLPIGNWRPARESGQVVLEAPSAGLADFGLCFETLLLWKMPHCRTFQESYRRTGLHLLRGLVAGLRDVHGKPQMRARAESLGDGPLRFRPADFTAKLPSFYYDGRFEALHGHSVLDLEVNGLPLAPGHYDLRLKLKPGAERPKMHAPVVAEEAQGWLLLPSLHVPARKLAVEFAPTDGELPFDDALLSPEAMPMDDALAKAAPFARYVRRTRLDEKAHMKDWTAFYARLMRDGFGAADLQAMFDELVDWAARRQALDRADPHYGAIWSEEDKYDARDAAAATACFTRQYQRTLDSRWLDRARAARKYVCRSQMLEPGNPARHGGFVHMVHGIWGIQFTRLQPPYPGIDGVDTCVILHQLCRAAELGLPCEAEDRDALRLAAQWVANNEPLPGLFLHHEGATADCQNANALGLSALVRAYHTLAAAGDAPPAAWLDAAQCGVRHLMDGQEAIGVWPYFFADTSGRGQACHFNSIPDHGMGLVHLTRVCNQPPLTGYPGLHDLLKRAARWYLGVCRLDGDTIDLEYDQRADLGGDIAFSGFTWCRFTAAASLLRIADLTGELEPWRHLALRLMEHVRRKLWRSGDPSRAPVVPHARPDAPLATWCQTAEWNASLLSDMLQALGH
ncbi:MAG: hypothetical protein FJ272_15350 [Planctomycetes bacterium]|nr:hypothetical protein [Planctomycetota bacterium]